MNYKRTKKKQNTNTVHTFRCNNILQYHTSNMKSNECAIRTTYDYTSTKTISTKTNPAT